MIWFVHNYVHPPILRSFRYLLSVRFRRAHQDNSNQMVRHLCSLVIHSAKVDFCKNEVLMSSWRYYESSRWMIMDNKDPNVTLKKGVHNNQHCYLINLSHRTCFKWVLEAYYVSPLVLWTCWVMWLLRTKFGWTWEQNKNSVNPHQLNPDQVLSDGELHIIRHD